MASESDVLQPGPGEGRAYPMGRMRAVFKADHEKEASSASPLERCMIS